MNMVTDFCENTIVSLDQQKTQTKESLKQALHKEEYSYIYIYRYHWR